MWQSKLLPYASAPLQRIYQNELRLLVRDQSPLGQTLRCEEGHGNSYLSEERSQVCCLGTAVVASLVLVLMSDYFQSEQCIDCVHQFNLPFCLLLAPQIVIQESPNALKKKDEIFLLLNLVLTTKGQSSKDSCSFRCGTQIQM